MARASPLGSAPSSCWVFELHRHERFSHLFWHRRDLRLADNTGLQAAAALGPAVHRVYVLDPAIITPPSICRRWRRRACGFWWKR